MNLKDISPLKDKANADDKKLDEGTTELDKAIKAGNTHEDAEPSTRWQSMEELQRRMNSTNEEEK